MGTGASTMSNAPAMNINMNAYTELQARTQFVLDRVAFLKDVGLTLMNEGQPEADAKINVWVSNAYVPLVVRCIKSEDEAVRVEALWTVANLLGADTAVVREATKNALTSELLKSVLDYVFLESKETVECAAFLLANYARFKNMSYADAQTIVYTACAKGIITNGKAATDLLWAANYAADKFPAAIPLSLVVNTLGDVTLTKEKTRQLRRLLGIAAEQDGLVHASLLEPVLVALERQLGVSHATGVRAELFWILSNVLTEPGAPEVFYTHKELLLTVIDESCLASNAGLQAAYALANFVSMVKDPVVQESLARGVAAESLAEACAVDIYDLFYQLSFSEDRLLQQLGVEGLAPLQSYANIYYPQVDEVDVDLTDEDEDDDIEMAYDAVCTAPEVKVAEATKPSIAVLHMAEEIAPAAAAAPGRVPCAYELLYGSDRASCESSVVRHLVGLVERAMADPDVEGDGWVKVPMDTMLSVSDLVTLQHMGYVFNGDWMGVNPAIYSGY